MPPERANLFNKKIFEGDEYLFAGTPDARIDSARGNSGGPLLYRENIGGEVYTYVVGVVARGPVRHEPRKSAKERYGSYTRVGHENVYNWILDTLGDYQNPFPKKEFLPGSPEQIKLIEKKIEEIKASKEEANKIKKMEETIQQEHSSY